MASKHEQRRPLEERQWDHYLMIVVLLTVVALFVGFFYYLFGPFAI